MSTTGKETAAASRTLVGWTIAILGAIGAVVYPGLLALVVLGGVLMLSGIEALRRTHRRERDALRHELETLHLELRARRVIAEERARRAIGGPQAEPRTPR